MARIVLETIVAAPPERCFDLSLSVDLHLDAAASTGERAVGGTTSGLLGPGDTVTWEARRLGFRRRLTVQIVGYERPAWFRDEQVAGPFRSLGHDHAFERVEGGTTMRDVFVFSTRLAVVDSLALVPYLRRFFVARNELIVAEGEAGAAI